MVLYMVFE